MLPEAVLPLGLRVIVPLGVPLIRKASAMAAVFKASFALSRVFSPNILVYTFLSFLVRLVAFFSALFSFFLIRNVFYKSLSGPMKYP